MNRESMRRGRWRDWVLGGCMLAVVGGCGAPRAGRGASGDHDWRKPGMVRRVRCIYDQTPWLNVDRAGDRNPEGIRYRVFLDSGQGRGVLRDGKLHIELYVLERDEKGEWTRTLASDWHYPTSAFHTIAHPGILGDGYYVHLVWARKDIAGHDIEMITEFEDPNGNTARSGTKGLRVPQYLPGKG